VFELPVGDILPGSVAGGGAVIENVTTATQNNPYWESTSGTYEAIGSFRYGGTIAQGALTFLKAILSSNSGGDTGSVKIFDVTNSLTIAEGTGLVLTTAPAIHDLGAISNLPTADAVFEIQIKKDFGKIRHHSLSMQF